MAFPQPRQATFAVNHETLFPATECLTPDQSGGDRAGLLVSVRDLAEARIAMDAGVAIVDLKEPLRGPLGAVDQTVIDEVGGLVETMAAAGSAPHFFLSAALGELSGRDWLNLRLPGSFQFAKFGMAGIRSTHEATRLWNEAGAWLGRFRATPVIVAYADHGRCEAMRPEEVLDWAADNGCQAFLVDTFDKSSGRLLDSMPLPRIDCLVRRARSAGMRIGLAGSLDRDSIPVLCSTAPDWIGVRGAACEGGREGQVSAARIAGLLGLPGRPCPEPADA